MLRTVPIALILMLAPAGAALAQVSSTSGGTAVPEPTNITLFAIGLAGLIIGRRVAKRKD
ncbi:PEP-CTERM sorting domain-containing protein [Novosphingobium sp.]|uniref:PEP-CTERM sorting domain-containing protein n=1 Tax=Novosphingobium sp. TaxID=1874826 RepID=UPI003016E5EE